MATKGTTFNKGVSEAPYQGSRASSSGQISYSEDDLKPVLHNAGLFDKEDFKIYDKFSMFGFFNTVGRLGLTREYVFITKPDLFIFKNGQISRSNLHRGTTHKEFISAIDTHPNVLRQLQYSLNTYEPFSPLLYNMRSGNIDLPDLEAAEMETAVNMWGQKSFYRRSSTQSNTDHTFSIEFNDTKYGDVYTFFKLFDLYEEQKAYGLVPLYDSEYYRYTYIYGRRHHDQMALFKFIVGEDGSELIYWTKFYGVYPKNVPRSVFSDMPEDGNLKLTINFKANFIEDCNPLILQDFNELSGLHHTYTGSKDLYNTDGFVRNEFVNPPYILARRVDNRLRYFLTWRD